jgi:hypothetical protein
VLPLLLLLWLIDPSAASVVPAIAAAVAKN